MSEELAETEMVGRYFCPGCEPDIDQSDGILFERACHRHQPDLSGIDDEGLPAHMRDVHYGCQEAGGPINASVCWAIHGPARHLDACDA